MLPSWSAEMIASTADCAKDRNRSSLAFNASSARLRFVMSVSVSTIPDSSVRSFRGLVPYSTISCLPSCRRNMASPSYVSSGAASDLRMLDELWGKPDVPGSTSSTKRSSIGRSINAETEWPVRTSIAGLAKIIRPWRSTPRNPSDDEFRRFSMRARLDSLARQAMITPMQADERNPAWMNAHFQGLDHASG